VACRRALALYTRAEGGAHPDVANALVELGQILEARDHLRPARKCHARALAILSAPAPRGAPPDPDIVRLRVRARVFGAGLDRALGAYAAAGRGFAAALREATRAFGPRDLDVAGILNNLGVLRKYQGRYPEAVRFYKRALPLLKAAGDREALATLYHNLGGIEHARGRFARAEGPARRAVELRTRARGANHVEVAADVAALAAVVEGRGRVEEAARLYGRALAIFTKVLGPRSYEVGVNLAGLAGVRQAQGRLGVAERLYRESLGIHERLFGAGHVEVAITLNNLALVLADRGELAAARREMRRALVAFRAACGPRHPSTRSCAANVARLDARPS